MRSCRHAFHGLIKSQVQGIARRRRHGSIHRTVNPLRSLLPDELDSGGMGLRWLSGKDSSNLPPLGEDDIQGEIVARQLRDLEEFLVERIFRAASTTLVPLKRG